MFLNAKQLGTTKQFTKTLDTSTIRSFDGGLNVIDADLNMKPKYAVVLDNMERGIDGTLAVRPGTRLFSTLPTTAPITNSYYFNGYLVVVTSDGQLWKVLGTGVASIFTTNTGLSPWIGSINTVLAVSFAVFNSDLIICCGVKPPLIVPGNVNNLLYNQLNFLVDLGSGSNVNTPVGSIVVSHAQYTIIAGIPAKPSTVSISARGTSGTYVGDAAPNDAVEIDLGQRVSIGSSVITGMVSYRDKLLVTFERGVLPLNLGIYAGSPSVHTPSDDGFIEEFGCLAHRSLVSVGDDTFYVDNIGVNSIQRIVLYNTLRPRRASELIDPLITAAMQALTPAQISSYVFAVYDMRHKRYMLFVPTFVGGVVTETVVFSYTSVPTLKIEAWARLRGWIFTSACRTSLQNVIFGYQNKLYSYDFDNTTANADYIGDTTKAADGTGVAISFTWELPWADFGKRMNMKNTRYVGLDSVGTGGFTLNMYVDNIRTNSAGVDSPILSADMQGGSVGGYGLQHYGSTPYGGGRPTGDERLFAWNAPFKISKLQITGSTKLPLKFVSISLAYERGDVRR